MKTYDPHYIMAQHSSLPVEYALDRSKATAEAEKKGLIVVQPDDYTLQLDFDTEGQFTTFLYNKLPRVIEFLDVKRVWWTESKSGNKHVFVRMGMQLNIAERIALQTFLGSDSTREFLNLMRVVLESDQPVVLFEKPDAVEVVIYATDGYQPQLTDGK